MRLESERAVCVCVCVWERKRERERFEDVTLVALKMEKEAVIQGIEMALRNC